MTNLEGRLIGLVGKARHGKDTTAHYIGDELRPRFDTFRIGFADALKRKAVELGWDGEKNQNGRTLLQYIGVRERQDDPEFWIRQAMNFMELHDTPHTVWVVTDVRFRNEADAVLAKGGRLWRIVRRNPDGTPFDNGLTAEQKAHSSETDLDNYNINVVLTPTSLPELLKAVRFALRNDPRFA